jgi:hypothetical protein
VNTNINPLPIALSAEDIANMVDHAINASFANRLKNK